MGTVEAMSREKRRSGCDVEGRRRDRQARPPSWAQKDRRMESEVGEAQSKWRERGSWCRGP